MEIEVIEEKPINRLELKEKLDKIKKEQELGFRSNKTSEYLNTLQKQNAVKDTTGLKKKLEGLKIARLKEKHIEKLIDTQPKDAESIKVILSNEALTLRNEEIEKVVECFK